MMLFILTMDFYGKNENGQYWFGNVSVQRGAISNSGIL